MAIQVWQHSGADHYLIDCFAAKCDYHALWNALLSLVRRYPPSIILIEDTATGSALISQAEVRLPFNIQGVVPTGSKFERLRRHYNLIRRGHIHVPETADWSADWIEEIVAFPNGDHDDQVDALSQYLDLMATHPMLVAPKRAGGIATMLGSSGNRFAVSASGQTSTRAHVALGIGGHLSTPYPSAGAKPRLEPSRSVRVETPLGTVIVRPPNK